MTWDMALDHGPQGISALQALYRTITKPKTGQNCSICDSVVEDTYFEHYTTNHTPIPNPELVVLLRNAQVGGEGMMWSD